MEIVYFETIPSTNSLLLENSKKNAKSWTVYWTKNQTQGKGYAGNVWEIKKNENLAFSVLIKCDIGYGELVYFNQWVSIVLAEYLMRKNEEVFVKWPNDIIVRDKKVCGVLIETNKVGSQMNIVVGVGLNVNQKEFEGLPNAGSLFTQIGREFDIEVTLSELLTELQNKFDLIQGKSWDYLFERYNQMLYRRDVICEFEVLGERVKGKILGINHDGNLNLRLENGSVGVYKTKEIKMIY